MDVVGELKHSGLSYITARPQSQESAVEKLEYDRKS